MFYKLVGHDPVQCASGLIWAEWYETAGESRIVARDEFDGFLVSTIFAGIDTSATGFGPPTLFETMTFRNGRAGDSVTRYATWSEAEDGHRAAVNRARDAARPRVNFQQTA